MIEEKNIELDPLCFKNETIDLNGVKTEYGMQVAITNKGELIPCCYLDTTSNQADVNYQKLLSVSKISDYDNIEEIYSTKEWIEFAENLEKHKGFFACKITCPKRENKDNIVRKEKLYYKGKKAWQKDF